MEAITKAMVETHGVTDFVCECCERELNPKTLTWLELNAVTCEYARPGKAKWSDSDESQGCFPFGQACARRILKSQRGSK